MENPSAKPAQEPQETSDETPFVRKPWQEPKLAFVEPKLTKHGKLEEVTGQFIGAFSP